MYKVTKEIYFCYGHRLLDYDGQCAHPHGHNGKIEIVLTAETLDKRGMVYDFGDIKEIIQKWVDSELDHKMILRKDDALIPVLKKLGEPYFEMMENPTAENLARLIFEYGKGKGLPISEVIFWETPNSSARYSG
ncbi:MAG: 6-carboxytetrahydropterin synthase QueD [Candidatus Omnitrophica bacterium]|nr:6-carboxytetrahydropterin synthase QueD [Candidatus Omnitrophota bacterium]